MLVVVLVELAEVVVLVGAILLEVPLVVDAEELVADVMEVLELVVVEVVEDEDHENVVVPKTTGP